MRGNSETELCPLISARGKRFAIVASRFNSFVTEQLVKGARQCVREHGGTPPFVVWVPGALEIAVVAKELIRTEGYNAIVCIAAIIKGETDHYAHVARDATANVSRLNLAYDIPVTCGILTTDTVEQALNRAGIKHGNTGYHAMLAAMEVASVCENIRGVSENKD